MVETTAGPDRARRLDELAGVTREYSRYMSSVFGLAATALGAWMLGATLVGVRWPRAGMNLAIVTPLVWLCAVSLARARYQRYGVVAEARAFESSPLRSISLGFTYFFCVLGVLVSSRFGTGTLVLGAVTFVAVPALAVRLTRGTGDATVTVFAVALFGTFDGHARSLLRALLLSTAYLGFALAGIWSHVRFRRLERRLAALKGGLA
jgi:hypothetical protein